MPDFKTCLTKKRIGQAMGILSIYDTIMSDVSKIWDLFEDHED